MSDITPFSLPGVHASPNIQKAPDIYEIENCAADPDHSIERVMATLAPWHDKVVLDLGAGAGFHLARQILDEHQGTTVEYHYCLYSRQYDG